MVLPVRAWFFFAAMVLAVGLVGAASAPETPIAPGTAPVVLLRIDGAIGPATADYLRRGLERAATQHAQLAVLQMDTPGGLDTSMRVIIKAILGSPMPVAGFVAPRGARAASAGTYILYATHIAAMAPATNLGAATPIAVGIGGPAGGEGAASSAKGEAHDALAAKRVNDATAYIRSLAQLRGRDVAWAEQAVREAVSLPAADALQRKVIDLIAADVPDLLKQLDGRVLPVTPGEGAAAATVKLATAHAPVVAIDPDGRDRFLAAISDPSLTLLLMLVGIYGLLFEFMSPGAIAPGVIGGVCLLLGMWGLQMLPINIAGLALVLLGIAFFVGEALIPSHGILGAGGVVAFGLGALLLIDTEVPGFGVPLPVVGGLTALAALFVAGVATMAARARTRPVVSGAPALIGVTGTVLEAEGREGWAEVEGERWRVRLAGDASAPLHAGERVTIRRVEGLMLDVQPLANDNKASGATR